MRTALIVSFILLLLFDATSRAAELPALAPAIPSAPSHVADDDQVTLDVPVPSRFSIEILGGSLTYHVVAGDSQYFTNKVSGDGRLISNFLYGISASYIHSDEYYITGRFFKGNNSINQSINGGTLSGGPVYKYCDIGFIIGGYFQDDYKYAEMNLMPFSIGSGSNALVPILGIEVNPKIVFFDTYFIKLNNILTPLITNHTLSVGMYF